MAKAMVRVNGADAMVMFNKNSDGYRNVEREIHVDEAGQEYIWFHGRKVLVEKRDNPYTPYRTKKNGATMEFRGEQ